MTNDRDAVTGVETLLLGVMCAAATLLCAALCPLLLAFLAAAGGLAAAAKAVMSARDRQPERDGET